MKNLVVLIWLFIPVALWGQVMYLPDPNNKGAKQMVYSPDTISRIAALMHRPGIVTELSIQEIGPIKNMNINVVTLKDVTHKTEWKALQLDYSDPKRPGWAGSGTIDMDEWDGLVAAIHMIDNITRDAKTTQTLVNYYSNPHCFFGAMYNNLNWTVYITLHGAANAVTMDDLLQFVKIVEGEKAKINN